MTQTRIVIDTENYAGNFEREMCAYLTGQFGECGVGDTLAEFYRPEIVHATWWSEHTMQVADDNGCARPVSIHETPGWFNNGMGNHYRDNGKHDTKAQKKSIESYIEYHAAQQKMVQERLEQKNFETSSRGWTEAACKRTISSYENGLKKLQTDNVHKYPAYLSVAIFVDTVPPQAVLDELVARTQYFAAHQQEIYEKAGDRRALMLSKGSKPIKLTQIRLLEMTEKVTKQTALKANIKF